MLSGRRDIVAEYISRDPRRRIRVPDHDPSHLTTSHGIPGSQTRSDELDHLIGLSTGGASDYRNLCPQPNGFTLFKSEQNLENDKDAVEAEPFGSVCARRVTHAQAQTVGARDWTTLIGNLGFTSPLRKSS